MTKQERIELEEFIHLHSQMLGLNFKVNYLHDIAVVKATKNTALGTVVCAFKHTTKNLNEAKNEVIIYMYRRSREINGKVDIGDTYDKYRS